MLAIKTDTINCTHYVLDSFFLHGLSSPCDLNTSTEGSFVLQKQIMAAANNIRDEIAYMKNMYTVFSSCFLYCF